MTVTGPSETEWQDFFTHGGNITCEVDARDVASDDFENASHIKPKLFTGFETPPTSLIQMPEAISEIFIDSSPWTKIHALIYQKGGSVIYKKLPNGRYQADCSIP